MRSPFSGRSLNPPSPFQPSSNGHPTPRSVEKSPATPLSSERRGVGSSHRSRPPPCADATPGLLSKRLLRQCSPLLMDVRSLLVAAGRKEKQLEHLGLQNDSPSISEGEDKSKPVLGSPAPVDEPDVPRFLSARPLRPSLGAEGGGKRKIRPSLTTVAVSEGSQTNASGPEEAGLGVAESTTAVGWGPNAVALSSTSEPPIASSRLNMRMSRRDLSTVVESMKVGGKHTAEQSKDISVKVGGADGVSFGGNESEDINMQDVASELPSSELPSSELSSLSSLALKSPSEDASPPQRACTIHFYFSVFSVFDFSPVFGL